MQFFCDFLILKFMSSEHVQENSSTLLSSGVPVNDTLLLYGVKTFILLCSPIHSLSQPIYFPSVHTQMWYLHHSIKEDQSNIVFGLPLTNS